MAYVNGQSLERRIAERGRLDAAGTMSIVAQVGRALQAAHEAGIVHRDVKPGNIICTPGGTVVLVDFGVARSTQSAALTGAEEVVGTAHYLAPEQVSRQPVGPATDVYALGAVAYACLAGHPPFLGPSPVAVAAQHLSEPPPPLPGDVPPPARALVATALAKDPAARFPSAGAMAAAAETAELSVLRTGVCPGPVRIAGRTTPPEAHRDRGARRIAVAARGGHRAGDRRPVRRAAPAAGLVHAGTDRHGRHLPAIDRTGPIRKRCRSSDPQHADLDEDHAVTQPRTVRAVDPPDHDEPDAGEDAHRTGQPAAGLPDRPGRQLTPMPTQTRDHRPVLQASTGSGPSTPGADAAACPRWSSSSPSTGSPR
jgi:hypothetical protein